MRALIVALFLTGCASAPVRDYPHGPRCAQDGVHRHAPDTTGARK